MTTPEMRTVTIGEVVRAAFADQEDRQVTVYGELTPYEARRILLDIVFTTPLRHYREYREDEGSR